MLNRKMAIRHGVRLRCHVLDQVVGSCDQEAVLEKVCALLKDAIRNAVNGSLVTGRGRFRTGQVELHIRHARAAPANAVFTSEIDWIDEVWSWSPGDVALAAPGAHKIAATRPRLQASLETVFADRSVS